MKRFLCFTLIFIIIFNSVVFADGLLIPDEDHTFYGINTNRYYSSKDEAVRAELEYLLSNGEPNFWLFLSTSLGVINSGDIVGTLKQIFNSNFDDLVTEIDISDKGQLKFTASTLVKLRNLIEQQLKEQDKEYYTIYPASGGDFSNFFKTTYFTYSSYALSDPTTQLSFRKYFSDTARWVNMSCDGSWVRIMDSSKYMYIYKDSSGNLKFTDREGNGITATILELNYRSITKGMDEDSFNTFVSTMNYYNYTPQIKNTNPATYTNTNTDATYGHDLVVFNSLNALFDYIYNKPAAYYTSNYNNKTYQDITLSQETIKNYTTENVQNIYNTVNNNAADALTQDELQKIIDSTVTEELEKINSSLDDVNDNLEGVNAALNKILKSLDKSGEELKTHTSWLEKIYKVLQRMDETLLVISSDLDDILEDDGLLDQQTSISSLTAVLNIFLYGVPEPEEEPVPASVYYDDSSGEYVEEPVVLSARYASRSGGGVVGLMFDKFPFCVPWDVYYCFLSLAETPEAPHFTFPFVIDSMGFRYEFNFNLSRFSMLSELTRMFLTLTFVVYMTHLTKKIVGGK